MITDCFVNRVYIHPVSDSYKAATAMQVMKIMQRNGLDNLSRQPDVIYTCLQLQDDVTNLQKSYAEAAASTSAVVSDQSKCSVVIRNLKYEQNESTDNNITKNKVNCLIRDGLKLTNVKISTAERKQTRDGRPGIIIATVATAEQKSAVMQRKKDLRKIKNYESVYLEDERSPSQRLNESNMRSLLKACGKSGDYVFSNGRLFPETTTAAVGVYKVWCLECWRLVRRQL